MTEKTDIRDSDEKVVEIEMERLDKKKCSSQFTLSSDCIRRFCEKYREARERPLMNKTKLRSSDARNVRFCEWVSSEL